MGRAPCCQKVGLKRGRWTAEEDELLLKYIQANGEGSWRSLPKNAGLLRCGKSCRLRWINYLRADLKRGNISSEEEEIIIKMQGSVGNRWSLIAGHLPGRTDNEIKNYWNSHLSRRIHTFKRPNDESPVIMDIGKIAGGPRRRGSKTSRSKKRSPSNVEIRKGEEIDSLGQEGSSTISSDGPPHDESGAMMGPPTPLQLLEEEIFSCPDERSQDLSVGQFLDSEISGSDHAGPFEGMEFLEMDSCMLDGPCDQEVENGATHMGELSKDASDQNAMGGEASSSNTASSCFDQIVGLQDEWLDWEWDEVLEKVMDDGGNTCSSWLWENDNGILWEGDCPSAMMESQEYEDFSSWLLKQDTNITM